MGMILYIFVQHFPPMPQFMPQTHRKHLLAACGGQNPCFLSRSQPQYASGKRGASSTCGVRASTPRPAAPFPEGFCYAAALAARGAGNVVWKSSSTRVEGRDVALEQFIRLEAASRGAADGRDWKSSSSTRAEAVRPQAVPADRAAAAAPFAPDSSGDVHAEVAVAWLAARSRPRVVR